LLQVVVAAVLDGMQVVAVRVEWFKQRPLRLLGHFRLQLAQGDQEAQMYR
jgi:hypothetical protein